MNFSLIILTLESKVVTNGGKVKSSVGCVEYNYRESSIVILDVPLDERALRSCMSAPSKLNSDNSDVLSSFPDSIRISIFQRSGYLFGEFYCIGEVVIPLSFLNEKG
jgi:hypothetical protein